jgi:hypothetical protein
MAWDATVTLDADKTDVETVTAVFTDTDATTFSYSARVRADAGGRDAFIAAAIAARNAWRTRKTGEAGYKANIDARFLTMDV